MGYGEVGGGGSIDWVVVHGGASGGVTRGKDPEPAKGGDGTYGGGKLLVVIGGKRYEVDIKDDPAQIQIFWPPHHPDTFEADTSLKAKVVEARRLNAAATRAAGV